MEFPQEPGALRRFLDEVLGQDDDIVLFEYIKRDNRETGAALVGIEISERDDYEPLWKRMEASPLRSSSWRPARPPTASSSEFAIRSEPFGTDGANAGMGRRSS